MRRRRQETGVECRCPTPENTNAIPVIQMLARSTLAQSPLQLVMQPLLLADPSSLHHGQTTQCSCCYSKVQQCKPCLHTSCLGKVKLVLWTRCTDVVQSLHPMAALFWTESSVFVFDKLKADLPPASSNNQTSLVHQECSRGSILEFHLRLACQILEKSKQTSF